MAYQFKNQKELDDITDKLLNREKFSYDLNGDAFYNQYKDKFTQQGKMAMMDTMGQAAALTGGYGSSYAQQVGQQTYQGYLQNLNDVVPELYQLARDNYDREGDSLAQQYSLLSAQEEKEYGRHRDQVADNQYWANLSYQKEQDARQQELDAATLMAQGGDYSRLAKFYNLSEGETKVLQDAALRAAQGENDDEGEDNASENIYGGFSGTTREEAVAYLETFVVPFSDKAYSDILTRNDWESAKKSGQNRAEVSGYDTYEEYLSAYVEFVLSNPKTGYWWGDL